MTEHSFPPTRTVSLDTALGELEDRVDELESDLEDAEGTDATSLAQELQAATSKRDGVHWAVEEFGGDAEIALEAFTTGSRARVRDRLRDVAVNFGNEQLGVWHTAYAIADAPWLEGDEDFVAQCKTFEGLPPGLSDWILDELDDLNDLSPGN